MFSASPETIRCAGPRVQTEFDDVCFSLADWERVHAVMAWPLVLDRRNLLKGQVLKSLGFEYESFGRPDPAEETLPSVA